MRPGIGGELLVPVAIERREGNLDDESRIIRTGEAMLVILIDATDDRDVRLRFVVVRDSYGLLLPRCPPGGKQVLQRLDDSLGAKAVLGALCHLVHHVAVDEFDSLGVVHALALMIRSYSLTVMRCIPGGPGGVDTVAGMVDMIDDMVTASPDRPRS